MSIMKMRGTKGSITGLQDLVEYVNISNGLLIEIGSFAGESTILFDDTKSFITIYAIDPWQNNYDGTDPASNQTETAEATFDEVTKNRTNIKKVKKSSDEAVNDFSDKSIDLVYIDGNHQIEAVMTDIRNYFPKVKTGGYISGHDYKTNNAIHKALLRMFGKEPDKTFDDRSWVYKVTPELTIND